LTMGGSALGPESKPFRRSWPCSGPETAQNAGNHPPAACFGPSVLAGFSETLLVYPRGHENGPFRALRGHENRLRQALRRPSWGGSWLRDVPASAPSHLRRPGNAGDRRERRGTTGPGAGLAIGRQGTRGLGRHDGKQAAGREDGREDGRERRRSGAPRAPRGRKRRGALPGRSAPIRAGGRERRG
jgi:hypothetical protein